MADDISRREALTAVGGAIAGAALAGCTPSPAEERAVIPEAKRQTPAIYLPHGGGPWPFVARPIGEPATLARLTTYLQGLAALAPKAALVISAHWEEALPTVTTASNPPLLFDYYGFAKEAYELTWPAPGDPALAARVQALLHAAGIESAADPRRGFDHGTFVPLKLTWPAAEVPTVQLSLKKGLDPAAHLAMGRALAPLRAEGVLIVGSGMSYHNMRGFGPAARGPSKVFDDWLAETVAGPADQRDARLARWIEAPAARACHPREEHLLPLMVVAGAAGADRGALPYRDVLMGAHVSACHFG